MNVARVSSGRMCRAVIAVVLLLVVPACSVDPETRKAIKISRKLVNSLGHDAKTITVTFSAGTATLSGTVTSRATQELSEEVAMSVEGVSDVQNHIDAEQDGALAKLKNEASDALLEMSVDRALAHKVGSDFARAIEVEAVDGSVSLRGILPDRARRRLSVETASAVDGVKRVIDLLEVGSSKP